MAAGEVMAVECCRAGARSREQGEVRQISVPKTALVRLVAAALRRPLAAGTKYPIMKRPLYCSLFVLVGFLANPAYAAESPIEAVLRTDAARLKAMMAGDGAALGRVFSEAIIFGHSDGRLESK